MVKMQVYQFKQDDFVNVRLYVGSNVSTKENLELPDAYEYIEEIKKKHKVKEIEFILYEGIFGDEGKEINRKKVNL